MIGITALTISQETDTGFRPRPLEQGKTGGLTDIDPVAVLVCRTAGLLRDQLQGIETIQGHGAETVHTADHGRIA